MIIVLRRCGDTLHLPKDVCFYYVSARSTVGDGRGDRDAPNARTGGYLPRFSDLFHDPFNSQQIME